MNEWVIVRAHTVDDRASIGNWPGEWLALCTLEIGLYLLLRILLATQEVPSLPHPTPVPSS